MEIISEECAPSIKPARAEVDQFIPDFIKLLEPAPCNCIDCASMERTILTAEECATIDRIYDDLQRQLAARKARELHELRSLEASAQSELRAIQQRIVTLNLGGVK